MGVFKKINFGLKKTRNNMNGAIDNVLDSYTSIDEGLFDELEEALVMGDVGVATASEITAQLNERVRKKNIKDPVKVKDEIKEIVEEMLVGGEDMGLITIPSVILMIGVNGAGKTTTIGKLASIYKSQGKSVILAAADTFRAAAIDQLDVWAQRAGADIVQHKEGADPAAVIFDTISAAKARGTDIIICDTAGRLQNKKNLMDELAKIYKVIDRELPYSDREVLLVLDATTGQNAVNQAREFAKVTDVTGIVLTKLDGTARGGVVLAIKNELKIPVKFVGVGEQLDDLQPFNPKAFAEGLFETLPDDDVDEDMKNNYVPFEREESQEDYSGTPEELFGGLSELDGEEEESVEEELAEQDREEAAALGEEPEEPEETDSEKTTDAEAQPEEEEESEEDESEEDSNEEDSAEKEDGEKKKKGFFGRFFGK